MRRERRIIGVAAIVALVTTATAMALPPGAGAGLSAVYQLYDNDAVGIPNGHDAAKMSFDLPSSDRMVGSVQPHFRIRHDRTQQLKLSLKGPNGETVLLSNGETHGENLGSGPCGEDFHTVDFTGFSDSASQNLASGSAPYVGDWLPNEPLSALTDISPEGRWTLIAKDTNSGGEKGRLLCGLLFISLPPP